jgi:hypothetical protein
MLERWADRKGRIGQVVSPIVDVGTTRASSVRGWSFRPPDGDCGQCDWPQPALCSLAEAISGSPSPGRAARRRNGDALRPDPTSHWPVGGPDLLPGLTHRTRSRPTKTITLSPLCSRRKAMSDKILRPIQDGGHRSPCRRCGQLHWPQPVVSPPPSLRADLASVAPSPLAASVPLPNQIRVCVTNRQFRARARILTGGACYDR